MELPPRPPACRNGPRVGRETGNQFGVALLEEKKKSIALLIPSGSSERGVLGEIREGVASAMQVLITRAAQARRALARVEEGLKLGVKLPG